MFDDKKMKEKINNETRRTCLPDARIVYVRHATEDVPCNTENGDRPWGGICHLIHSEVTVAEFFS